MLALERICQVSLTQLLAPLQCLVTAVLPCLIPGIRLCPSWQSITDYMPSSFPLDLPSPGSVPTLTPEEPAALLQALFQPLRVRAQSHALPCASWF